MTGDASFGQSFAECWCFCASFWYHPCSLHVVDVSKAITDEDMKACVKEADLTKAKDWYVVLLPWNGVLFGNVYNAVTYKVAV
jgi:hypothetical protein